MNTVTKAGGYWKRRLARLAKNPSGAIYGTIVATALIAATGGHDADTARIAVTVLLTLLVFWLAHVYTEVLEHGLRRKWLDLSVVRTVMADEISMVEAPALSVVILLLGAVGWIDPHLAINLALVNGIVQLLFWGVAVSRRLGHSWPRALVTGLIDASFGVLVVLLEALLH
jgi:hypothetical protein